MTLDIRRDIGLYTCMKINRDKFFSKIHSKTVFYFFCQKITKIEMKFFLKIEIE